MLTEPQHKERRLILGSSSPRRRELLPLLGVPFTVRPADVEETNHVGEAPQGMAVRLSQDKAQALLSAGVRDLIVAADTLVALDGQVLGKPATPDEALEMLRRLRGRAHTVFSGVTVIDPSSNWQNTALVQTQVWMRDYSDEEISAYVSSGDPLDKAGAYAIQYGDFHPVARVQGCYSNVMGLALCHLYCLLRAAGAAPAQTPVAACDGFHQRSCDVAQTILSCRWPARQGQG